MTLSDIPQLRLANQKISQTKFTKPEEVVEWMGALQGQDYLMSLWAIALRTKGCTEKDVEKAIADRKIIRTWPMRRTLHWVTARDIHWMVALSGERIIKTYSAHMPQLGLSEEVISKARKIVTNILSDGKRKTREEIYRHFAENHVPYDQSRGMHILWRMGQEGVVCFGPREGKQQTFVLLDAWAPLKRKISRDEAIAEVALKYFTSHGPATIQDLAWWSGLTIADLKRGIAANGGHLVEHKIDGTSYYTGRMLPKVTHSPDTFLLPAFDEYFISYKDRSAVIDREYANEINHGAGMFYPIVVINGKIEGTWKRDVKKNGVVIRAHAFTKFIPSQLEKIHNASRRFGTFLASPVAVTES